LFFCLYLFCIYKDVFHIFFSRIPYSLLRLAGMQSALILSVWHAEQHKDPQDVTWVQAGYMGFYARVIDQSKANIFIKPGIMVFCIGYMWHINLCDTWNGITTVNTGLYVWTFLVNADRQDHLSVLKNLIILKRHIYDANIYYILPAPFCSIFVLYALFICRM